MNIIQKPSPNFFSRDGNPVKFVCVHIMDGSLSGTDDWFTHGSVGTPNAVSSHYGIGLNGEIHQYVQENMGAWTNGIVNKPTAQVVIDNPNVNQNKISVTIENEGTNLANAPEAQLNALANLIKDICTRYNLPIDRYHIIGHQEVDNVKKPYCPSPDRTVMNRLVERVKTLSQPITPQNPNMAEAKRLIKQGLDLLG